MATNLPTDIADSYPDRSQGDRAHQQHHDTVHGAVNELTQTVETGRLSEGALSATIAEAVDPLAVVPDATFDGITDDTAALSSALASSSVTLGGDTAYITTITPNRSNLTVTRGAFTLSGATTTLAASVYHTGDTDITYRGVTFKLDPTFAGTGTQRGLVFQNCQRVRLIDCVFEGMNHSGVRFDGCSDVVVQGCAFVDNNRMTVGTAASDDDYGDVAVFTSDGVVVRDCVFTNGGSGVSLYNSTNSSVRGCRIVGNPANVSAMGVYILGDSAFITVDDNSIEGFKNEGVVATNVGNLAANIKHVTVSNNHIVDCEFAAISFDTNVADAAAVGNQIDSSGVTTSQQIQVRSVTRSRIEGNSLSGTVTYAIQVQLSDSVICANNDIRSNPSAAQFRLNQNTRCTATGNIITVPIGKTGVQVYPSTAADQLDFSRNMIRGGDSTSNLLAWTTANNITYSTFTGNRFETGVVNLPVNQNTTFVANVCRSVTATVTNNGGCVIASNVGF